ncbi:MAG: hypothetical protein ABIJ96_18845 [Elusimicrobiota bacterium]
MSNTWTRLTMAVCLAGFMAAGAVAEDKKSADKEAKAWHGYRSFMLPVDAYVTQYLKKEDRIDLLVTFDAQVKDVKEKVTATILQNVLVIDVRPMAGETKASLLLLMNPKEAQYTALSLVQGEVVVIKRQEGDTEMTPMEMSSFRKLFR